jgi:Sulfotransferase domain
VVLSEDIVARPEATLRSLCSAIGMPWDAAMLSWRAGPKPFDGVWAPWWYKTAHSSTGSLAHSCKARRQQLRSGLLFELHAALHNMSAAWIDASIVRTYVFVNPVHTRCI